MEQQQRLGRGSGRRWLPRIGLSDSTRRAASRWRYLLLVLLTTALTAGAATLWVAETGGMLKISGLDGAFLLEIPEDPYGTAVVGVDATNGNIWTYSNRRLRAFDRDGVEFLDIASDALPRWHPNIDMAVDGDAGNVWLLLGARVYRFDLQGAQTGVFDTQSLLARIALDRSRATLWVSDGVRLRAFNADFQQTALVDLGSLKITFIAWDPYRDELWVAAGNKLRRYDHSGQQVAEMINPLASPITWFMSPDGSGGLWIGRHLEVYRIDSTDAVSAPLHPFQDFSLPFIIGMAANPRDQSIWIASLTHLRHFDTSGALLHERQLILENGAQRYVLNVSLFADLVPPTLFIAAPVAASHTNDSRPLITVDYLDPGSGVDPSSLSFTANGSPLAVTCTSAALSGECEPTADLPDGETTLTAVVSDMEGNESEPATVTFTIDTLAPQITVNAPAQDAFVNATPMVVSGSLDETAELTLNGATIPVNATNEFSASATLAEGLNLLTLAAVDRAGNQASIVRRVTLDTIAPAIPVASLIMAGGIDGDVVSVSGAAGSSEPGASIRLTNLRTGATVTTHADASGAFSAQIAAQESDTIRVQVLDASGNASESIDVSTGAPVLTLQISSPLHGAGIADRSVVVAGTVGGGSNVGVTVNGAIASTHQIGTDTSFAANVSLQPGANTISVIASDVQGNVVSRTLAVTRTGETPFAVEATPTVGLAPLSVGFRVAHYGEFAPSRIDLDYDGNGTVDQSVFDPAEPIVRVFGTAGSFTTMARVHDGFGASFVYHIPIFPQTLEQLDEVTGAVWQGFTTALTAEDTASALHFIATDAKANFAQTFAVLQTDMPEIVASFSPLRRTDASGSIAEYAVTREVDGVQRVFLVYFVRDGDGVWRVGGM